MHSVVFITTSAAQTRRIGALFARALIRSMPYAHACVCACEGDLGTGKTTFIQGMAQGFGIARRVVSPTFLLMRTFAFRSERGPGTLAHFDCWRIGARDVHDLGFGDMLRNGRAIICLEWADRIRTLVPKDAIRILFSYRNRKAHEITFIFP